MRRGTTPTHNFVLPFGVDRVSDLQIVYEQDGKEVLVKYKRNCQLDGNTVSVTLSQTETLSFVDDVNVEIQVRVVTVDGNALASDVVCVRCDKCLSDEVL